MFVCKHKYLCLHSSLHLFPFFASLPLPPHTPKVNMFRIHTMTVKTWWERAIIPCWLDLYPDSILVWSCMRNFKHFPFTRSVMTKRKNLIKGRVNNERVIKGLGGRLNIVKKYLLCREPPLLWPVLWWWKPTWHLDNWREGGEHKKVFRYFPFERICSVSVKTSQ